MTYKYRIRAKLNNELNRTIRNYNAKIRRLSKLNNNNDMILPDRITKKELLSQVNSAKDIRKSISDLKLFSKRDMENVTRIAGRNISNYELALFNKEKSKIKRRLTKEINKRASEYPIAYGKRISEFTYDELKDTYLTNLRTKRKRLNQKNYSNMTSAKFNNYIRFVARLDRQASNKRNRTMYFNLSNFENFKDFLDYTGELDYDKRLKQFRINYMNTLEKIKYYVPNAKYDKFINNLKNLSDEEFLDLFNSDEVIKGVMYEFYPDDFNLYDIQEYTEEIEYAMSYINKNIERIFSRIEK